MVGSRAIVAVGGAERPGADVGGIVAEPEQDRHDQRQGEDPRTMAPIRQPAATARAVRNGKKMSWPALVLAPKIPMTRPRSFTNQRVATVGPRTLATSPVPRPDSRPNSSVSCQISRTRLGREQRDAGHARLSSTTFLTPIRPISQPLIGPANP